MMERFRAFFTKVISPIAHLLIRMGVSPDAVTLVGTLGVAVGALVFFPQGKLLTGVLVITAFVFSDLLDGHMARTTGRVSKFGAFWDSTLDRIGDGAVFGGLLLCFAARPGGELTAWFALACLVFGFVTSYARARAEGLGITAAQTGIAERADRLVVTLVATGLTGIFGLPDLVLTITLGLLALASAVTVLQRMTAVRRHILSTP